MIKFTVYSRIKTEDRGVKSQKLEYKSSKLKDALHYAVEIFDPEENVGMTICKGSKIIMTLENGEAEPREQRRAELEIEYTKNNPIMKCCKHFGITHESFHTLCREYGVTPLRVCDVRKDEDNRAGSVKRSGLTQEMIVYLSERFTNASIARVFGYTKEGIRQIIQRSKAKEIKEK